MNDVRDAPLVSVVLPVHETGPGFLREAIESVRRQTETRWELVIVLDAATEACAVVARELAALEPVRIVIVGELGGKPRGSSGARNFGIASSHAPVISFLDADDVYEPDRLATRLERLEAHPEAAMAYGPTLYWYSWTGAAGSASRIRDYVPDLRVECGTVYSPPTFVLRLVSGEAAMPCTCSILVRRWAIEAVGGFDETFRDLYDDQVFYARVGSRFPVAADDRVLDRYRQHPESMTAQATREQERHARSRFLDQLEDEVPSARSGHDALRRSIARERWRLRHPGLTRLLRLARKATTRLLPRNERRGTTSQQPDDSVRRNPAASL